MLNLGIVASSFFEAAGVDPEAGLTLTRTDSAGALAAVSFAERTGNIVMACDIRFPTSTPTAGAVLWEQGGSGVGSYIGFSNATGSITFRCRAGDGGVNLSGGATTNAAVVDVTDYPTDGELHTVVWEMKPVASGSIGGSVRLWIDGVLKNTSTTTGGGNLKNASWSGGAAGGYTEFSANIPVGESTNFWSTVASLADASGLRVYVGQLSSAISPLAAGTGTVGLVSRGTYSPAYWGYVDTSTGTLSLTSGSYSDAFGPAISVIRNFANWQLGAITGDDTITFRVILDGLAVTPAIWTSIKVTVGGSTYSYTSASATVSSLGNETQYLWTDTNPFSTESSGTAFTWEVIE